MECINVELQARRALACTPEELPAMLDRADSDTATHRKCGALLRNLKRSLFFSRVPSFQNRYLTVQG